MLKPLSQIFVNKFGSTAVFDIEPFTYLAREARNYAKGHCEVNGYPSIFTDYYESDRFGAHATKFQAQYLVGLSSNTLYWLLSLFSAYLSNKKILREFGNPELESDEPYPHHGDLRTWPGTPVWVPVCDTRCKVASALTFECMRALINHEVGHIVHGHVDFLTDHYDSLSTVTTLDGPVTNERFMTLQTLEMNADAYATFDTVEGLKARFRTDGHLDEEELKRKLFFSCFALGTLFRFFGQESVGDVTINVSKHPPPRMRMHLHIHTHVCNFNQVWKLEQDVVERLYIEMIKGYVEAEKAARWIENQTRPPANLIFDLESAYPYSLTEYWTAVLRPKLIAGNYPHRQLPP